MKTIWIPIIALLIIGVALTGPLCTEPEPIPPPEDYRTFSEAYRFTGQNDYSIVLRDIGRRTTIDGKQAPEGMEYLMVSIQVTHLGSRSTTSQGVNIPDLRRFKLHGDNQIYRPETFSPHTSVGEMYKGGTLERGENKRGWVVFSVPADLHPQNTYLGVDMDSSTIWWSLAR